MSKEKLLYSLLLGCLLAFFYAEFVPLVLPDITIKKESVRTLDFEMPAKDTYLIITRGSRRPEEIKVNGIILDYFYLQHKSNGTVKNYVRVPSGIINPGMNTLELGVLPGFPDEKFNVRITNYMGRSGNDAFVVLDDSNAAQYLSQPENFAGLAVWTIIFAFIIFAVSQGYEHLSRKIMGQGSTDAAQKAYYYSYIPAILLFLFFRYLAEVSEYTFVLSGKFFFLVALVLPQAVYLGQKSLWFKKVLNNKSLRVGQSNIPDSPLMRMLGRFNLSDKVLCLFFVFWSGAALALVLNLNNLAESLANLAYLALFCSVVVMLLRLFKDNKRF